ncbi:hypothetical protein, partial [uncultured Sphingobacterium sp.]|uniref:hypothetical protein n=1 Tax=uncultured Sphingobacterium sp. TaxID=182688 RepID=UPI0025EDDDDF
MKMHYATEVVASRGTATDRPASTPFSGSRQIEVKKRLPNANDCPIIMLQASGGFGAATDGPGSPTVLCCDDR